MLKWKLALTTFWRITLTFVLESPEVWLWHSNPFGLKALIKTSYRYIKNWKGINNSGSSELELVIVAIHKHQHLGRFAGEYNQLIIIFCLRARTVSSAGTATAFSLMYCLFKSFNITTHCCSLKHFQCYQTALYSKRTHWTF